MTAQLRRGQVEDAPEIARVLVETWQSSYRGFLPAAFLDHMDVDRQSQRHRSKLNQGTPYLVLSTPSAKLLGFASYGPSRSPAFGTDWELYTLYVALPEQGKGWGRRMLTQVLSAIPSDAQGLGVEVMIQNPYRVFYEKNGFVPVGNNRMDLGLVQVENQLYARSF